MLLFYLNQSSGQCSGSGVSDPHLFIKLSKFQHSFLTLQKPDRHVPKLQLGRHAPDDGTQSPEGRPCGRQYLGWTNSSLLSGPAPAPAPAYRDNIDSDEYWTLDRVISIRRRYVQDIPRKTSPIVILLIIFHKTSHRFLSIVSKNVT